MILASYLKYFKWPTVQPFACCYGRAEILKLFLDGVINYIEYSSSLVGLSHLRPYCTWKNAPSITILCMWSSSYHRAQLAFWWCQTIWSEIFFSPFFQEPYQGVLFWSHDQNIPECVSRIKYLTWLAAIFRWWLKCLFIALSRISSVFFIRRTSQRCRFFFYHPPSMSMFPRHIGRQRKQVTV